MNDYNIKGNIAGGITVAIVALPLALAFGVQSGMGAAVGLYGAIILGFFASLLGGTPAQISGPTAPITVVSAELVMASVKTYGSLQAALPYILFVFFLAGLIQIALGTLKVGDFINYIPYPVISGFMTGIGVVLILLQIPPSFGQESPSNILGLINNYHLHLFPINWQAISISLATILIIYTTPKITKRVPGSIIAIVLSTYIVQRFQIDVPIIKEIPNELPELHYEIFATFSFTNFITAFVPALMIATVASIETLLSAVVLDNMTKTTHKSNRELIGQGIGNAISALFTGIPGAGATIRSTTNVKNGGSNQISGMTHAVVLGIILVWLEAHAEQIPLSTLAGILITVGFGVIDYKGLKHLKHIPRSEAIIIILVAVLTIFTNLLHAVSVGIVVACIVFMKTMSDIIEERSHISPINEFKYEDPWKDEVLIPEVLHDLIYIKHLHGPLFFGFTNAFHGLTKNLPDIKAVIIRMEHVPYIDQSGVYAIEDVYEYLANRKIKIIFTGLNKQPETIMRSIEIIPNQIPETQIFERFADAVRALEKEYTSQE